MDWNDEKNKNLEKWRRDYNQMLMDCGMGAMDRREWDMVKDAWEAALQSTQTASVQPQGVGDAREETISQLIQGGNNG